MAEKLYMTALSPTMERGVITEWHKTDGDAVKSGDILCEVETDKAVMEYEADFDAVLLKIIVNAGQSAAIGDTIAVYGEAGEDYSRLILSDVTIIEEPKAAKTASKDISGLDAKQDEPSEPSTEKKKAAPGGRIKSSPLARMIAADLHIDLSTIEGSGIDGRIIKRDVELSAPSGIQPEASGIYEPPASMVKPVGGMRASIAKRLSASMFSAPHYYLSIQADMSTLMSARKNIVERSGKKVSINSFLIKLSAAALKKHPVVNSTWEGDKIRAFGSADIGFAVALDDGLIAPVIKNCEAKGILSIDEEFKTLAGKAKEGKLVPADYVGAGFSISNLGGFGIEEFTAIINPPGSAILAVGAVIKQPVVLTDESDMDLVVVKPMMKMTLSCDHRVIDGAVGAAFLSDLKRMIEEPIEALM
ncbi:MAG: 2-oxo acid dehydrogenase subunit E2 [Spirochaetales bacterium]|nr:2-oxo acid dehydrogenase subunit E2 [Spirochaetales bacterium]